MIDLAKLAINQAALNTVYANIMVQHDNMLSNPAEDYEDDLTDDINAMIAAAGLTPNVIDITVCPADEIDSTDDVPTVEAVLGHVYSQIQAGTHSYGWDGLWDVIVVAKD